MSIGEGEAASELLAAVERYRSRPAIELSGAQIGEELVRLRHVADLIEVEFAKLSGRFAETDEWDGSGYFSPVHWIRVNCHMGSGAAWDRVNVGEQLGGLPLAYAAVAEGGISFTHLALLAQTAAAVADGPRPLNEARLLAKGWSSPSLSSARPASTSGTPPTQTASRWRNDRRRRSASSR